MEAFALIVSAILKAFSLWFFVTALAFWKKPAPYPPAPPRTRFAVLIPARNEEAVIGALVESLRAQDYPRALYDIFVIPNNCTDRTEDAARAAGARIFRCFEPVRCKGDALHEAVAWLLPRGYDAVCVFDADNVADRAFLARMNDAFCAGARVAKGRLVVKNPFDGGFAGCYALYFTCCDYFFSRSRANLGLSAKLVGTGFAVHRTVLERLGGWNTQTLAEDAEFAARCAALGERIFWVPEAVSLDEAPATVRASLRQRRRWVSGIMSAAAVCLPALLRALRTPRRLLAMDMLFFLCAQYAAVLSLLPLAVLAALRPAAALAGLAASACGLLLAGAALAHLSPCRGPRIIRAVLRFPLFMASWLPLQALSFVRRTTYWQPIRHGAAQEACARPRLRRAA